MRHYHQPSFWDEIKGIFFDHSGRISASTYTSSMALVLFYYVFVQYILIPYIVQPLCGPLTPVFAFLLLISFFIAGYGCLVASIQRLHDLDYSGYTSLLSFIPIVNFILFLFLIFKTGQQEDNGRKALASKYESL